MMLANATLAVGVILYEGVTILDFSGPVSYLELLPSLVNTPVEFYGISTAVGPLQGNEFTPLYATTTYQDAPEHLDILILPGANSTKEMVKDPEVVGLIRDMADKATDVLTVCTGTRLLGATGLLDGKSATTNKRNYEEISTSNPNVNWVKKARWVEEGKWWTSSGVVAGVDMSNAYVAKKYGADVAAKIADILEYIPTMDSTDDPFAATIP